MIDAWHILFWKVVTISNYWFRFDTTIHSNNIWTLNNEQQWVKLMLYRSANSLIYLYVPFNLLSLLIRGQNIATRQISTSNKKNNKKLVWYCYFIVYDGITFAYLAVKEFWIENYIFHCNQQLQFKKNGLVIHICSNKILSTIMSINWKLLCFM